MYKNLHFKIILIFVIFTVTLMAAMSAVLIGSSHNFYSSDFKSGMRSAFDPEGSLMEELKAALAEDDYSARQNEILKAYSGTIGVSKYRNYYILDMTGAMLDGSDTSLGQSLEITPNIVTALAGGIGSVKEYWTSYIDYAVYLENTNKCIIYVKDSQDEVRSFAEMVFQITVQAIFLGLLVAIVLSFFLAKAIASPIRSLTSSAQRIAEGEFSEEIKISANDEIGTLSLTFNNMKNVLKNTLDEISGERQKFETLFLYLNDAVLAFDSGGHLMHINKTAKKLFGCTGEEKGDGALSFSHMIKILRIDYREVSGKYRESRNYVIRDVIFNGKALDITFAEFRYTQSEKENVGIMCVIHDNTGRYELDKSRREFVADVSHELRTPLTSIKGAVETVLEYPDLDTESRDNFLHMAVDECDRMTRIVSELLILSRLDNNRTAWRIETFDVPEFCHRLYDVMSVEAKAHGHIFTVSCPEDIPPISGDKEKLQQVIINIIANAIKYTPDGGKIELEAKEEESCAVISVSDNGMGVPAEDLPRIFERFYRVEKSRTSDTGGTGLGLAIAKEIVDAHGGQIWMKSIQGKGSTVYVKLPYVTKLTDGGTGMETTGVIKR